MEYNLKRFISAQEYTYNVALDEIKNGRKESHWIWYIFPQLYGLGSSDTADFYGITCLEEAVAYLENGYLKHNLLEISKVLLGLDNDDIEDIMGYPDNLKLLSCITLFHVADESIKVFSELSDKYYNGEWDNVTLEKLGVQKKKI